MNINTRYITNTNNFMYFRNGNTLQHIIIHTNATPAPDGLFDWFQNNTRQVSAHYQVYFDGRVDKYVGEDSTAYHSGVWNENLISIGIEHEDGGNYNDANRTNELYESSAQLCADIYRRYNWDKSSMALIKPHKEYGLTACPDGLNVDRIRGRVNEILNVPQDSNWHVYKNNNEIYNGPEVNDGFNTFCDQKGDKVIHSGRDFTSNFFNDMNNFQKQVQDMQDQINQLNNLIDTDRSNDNQPIPLDPQIGILTGELITQKELNNQLVDENTKLTNELNNIKPHSAFLLSIYEGITKIVNNKQANI